MINVITVAQVIAAIILIILVLLQNKNSGVGGLFGGGGGGDSAGGDFRTKRGFEKKLFITTIIFSILFLGLSLANILIQA